MEAGQKVTFKDLSGWLKTAVVLFWIMLVINVISAIVTLALGTTAVPA